MPHEEGEVKTSKLSDEAEWQDPNQSSVENALSLSHGVKGPRKDKVDDVPEDVVVGKKGKKMKDSGDEPELGKDKYVCMKYVLPKSGKTKRSKTFKSEGSKGSADQESNWEKHRALLSNEEVEDVVYEQGSNEADDNLWDKKAPGKKNVTVKEDLVVMHRRTVSCPERKRASIEVLIFVNPHFSHFCTMHLLCLAFLSLHTVLPSFSAISIQILASKPLAPQLT